MDTFLAVAALVIALPIAAYFIAKFGVYGFLRGIERYCDDCKRRVSEKEET